MPAAVRVVGAGIAGAACASGLRRAGIPVSLHERGRAPGGRLAAPELHGRRVDLGAAYFTVGDDGFRTVVDAWQRDGLARPWTDTFDVVSAGDRRRTTGPLRWSAPQGLRSLVRAILGELVVDRSEITALGSADDITVLAMPDPQAARIAGVPDFGAVPYEPVLAVAAGWSERCWPFADATFINDDPDITLAVDDGARRGDGAPVLVVHTTSERARAHLDRPDDAIEPVLKALRRVLGIDADPAWTYVHRWTFAKPAGTHGDAPFYLDDRLGICGDSWCPSGSPRVEAAWLSGDRLASALAARGSGARA